MLRIDLALHTLTSRSQPHPAISGQLRTSKAPDHGHGLAELLIVCAGGQSVALNGLIAECKYNRSWGIGSGFDDALRNIKSLEPRALVVSIDTVDSRTSRFVRQCSERTPRPRLIV